MEIENRLKLSFSDNKTNRKFCIFEYIQITNGLKRKATNFRQERDGLSFFSWNNLLVIIQGWVVRKTSSNLGRRHQCKFLLF